MSRAEIPTFGYLFIQCAMLFMRYGLKYEMPFWVTWFPTLFIAVVLFVVLIFIVAMALLK